jgi:PiT family inorganic phosphate transporter|tara:strand:+ start:4882 stop:6132 length:1251 start_codon:yes stop_codon:yes gene_type:complete
MAFVGIETEIIILACVFGFIMAWGIGANDVANAFGTSVGSGAITLRTALLIACIFEFSGAYLAGGEVTDTIRKGIIDSEQFIGKSDVLVFGMMSALLAAGLWLFLASTLGWPVSTTHSIIGGIVGFSIIGLSFNAVNWEAVSSIATTWVLSPILSGVLAFFVFKSIKFLILDTENPFSNTLKFSPIYLFFVGFVISMLTFLKGLKHVGIDLDFAEAAFFSFLFAIGITIIGLLLLKTSNISKQKDASIESFFAILVIFTACAMAFAHGSNDVANAVGPLAAVVNTVSQNDSLNNEIAVTSWILLLGSIAIVIGLLTYGFKVIGTVGKGITKITPSSGFAAELSAATIVVLSSSYGFPVSTTHTLVGAIIGIGLVNSSRNLDWSNVVQIFSGWIVTIPVGGILSILIFYIFKSIYSF